MTWRRSLSDSERGVIVFALILMLCGFVLWALHGCAHPPPPCVPTRTTAIVAECRLQYERAGCGDDPEAMCPELVKACDARIDALTDAEVCGQ